MKRLWIAITLILIIIATSIGDIWYLNHTIRSITNLLDTSLSAARTENWEQSREALLQARQIYDRSEGMLSVTINEKQLDEVCLNFARTQEGCMTDDLSGYQMELSGLRESVEDLLRSETLSLGNLF
ncbi:MAG: DUF4363 family protein [Eubacteriales bacterium]|nr:DUF4363 family protein [Eubacteriales bacterium]